MIAGGDDFDWGVWIHRSGYNLLARRRSMRRAQGTPVLTGSRNSEERMLPADPAQGDLWAREVTFWRN